MPVSTSPVPTTTSEHAAFAVSLKPWSPWPALKPVSSSTELPLTQPSTGTPVSTLQLSAISSPEATVGPLDSHFVTVTSKVKHEPVLERPSTNKRRTKFPSTTHRVARIYVQPKRVVTTTIVTNASITHTTSIPAPMNNTNSSTNISDSALLVTVPFSDLPVPTRSVDLTYRSRLVTGTVPFTTSIPNSTSSLDLSSSSFMPTNTGPEGRVEEKEASLHLGDASIGGVVTAAVLGTLVILGALVGLGFWAWRIRVRISAGATVSCCN